MTEASETGVQQLSKTRCTLGEGAFWHPVRETFFWFDILSHRLFEHDGTRQRGWQFDRAVSAAGWIDEARLIVASETDLFEFDVETGAERHLVALEADTPSNRSNDGRADPQGGFWIGTMAYDCAPGGGAIYRYYRGELRRIFDDIGISNAICFAPDAKTAYFTDTLTQKIMRVALDEAGWPVGDPSVFVDLGPEGLNPDGAVVDTQGRLWSAQWGASRVACYDPSGAFVRAVDFPGVQTSCPCFGGPSRQRLFVTTAAEGLPEDVRDAKGAGFTYFVDLDGDQGGVVQGQAEPRVIL